MDKDTAWYVEQFWSFPAVALAIAIAGVAVKRLIKALVPHAPELSAQAKSVKRVVFNDPGDGVPSVKVRTYAKLEQDRTLPLWFRIWFATLPFHPVLVGALAGLLPIPVPVFMSGTVAAMLWFAAAGAVSGQLYAIVTRTAEMVPSMIRAHFGGASPGVDAAVAPEAPEAPEKPDNEGP